MGFYTYRGPLEIVLCHYSRPAIMTRSKGAAVGVKNRYCRRAPARRLGHHTSAPPVQGIKSGVPALRVLQSRGAVTAPTLHQTIIARLTMESESVYMKVLSTRVSGGYTDTVTGESFEPRVELKLCNQSMSKFFTVRISDMPAFPVAVFVSGHEYERPASRDDAYDPRVDYEMFSKRIADNCRAMCTEIEMAFPNVRCEVRHTGALMQADYRSIRETVYAGRLHHYNYGTVVSLRLSISAGSHVMDVGTYRSVYEFLRNNSARGLFHVYDTYDVYKYMLDSMRLERNAAAGLFKEFEHDATSHAFGYRTHSVDLHTSCVRVDRYVYTDIADGSVLEYDYESWMDSDSIEFHKVTWPLATRTSLSNVRVEFKLVCERGIIVDVEYTVRVPGDKNPVRVSYATSKQTAGIESAILYYFVNDTHAGYTRPIRHRRLYCATFSASDDGRTRIVGKRQFCRRLQARMAAHKMDAVLAVTVDRVRGEMFTFDSGAAVEYIDTGRVGIDVRTALAYTTAFNIPLGKIYLLDGTDVSAFVFRCTYGSLEQGIVNAHRRPDTHVLRGPRPTVGCKEFAAKKSIALIENFQLKVSIKHNLSPSNVAIVPLEYALRTVGGPAAINKIGVDIFEYDSGAARKFNVKAYCHDDTTGYPPTVENRVMIVGRRGDTFVEMLRRAHTKSPDAYGNESAVMKHVQNAIADSHFGMAVRFFVDRYTSRFERLTDSWYVFDASSNFVRDIGPKTVIADVVSTRTISTGDIIVNGNKLLHHSTIDPTVAAIKDSIVTIVYERGINDISCCARALVSGFRHLLNRPIDVSINIDTCFGGSFAPDPETQIRARAASRVLSTNRTNPSCSTMIGDVVPMVPVVNILTDDEALVPVFNGNAFRYNYLHRIKYDARIVEFMEGLFGQQVCPNDLERFIAAKDCAKCLNVKCTYETKMIY